MTSEHHLTRPSSFDYAGVFFIAFATLMFELLLTRVFSVIMWYHFAFVAISAALLGMTIGAIGVYLKREVIKKIGERTILSRWSLYFGLSIVVADICLAGLPVTESVYAAYFFFAAIFLAVITAPFVASGVVLALALTHFHEKVGRVYAVDLLGAALGCVGVGAALRLLDGPTAIMVSGLIAMCGAWCFGRKEKDTRALTFVSALLVALICFSTYGIAQGKHPFRLMWGKYGAEEPALSEEWNSFSRVSVFPNNFATPFGWGMSDHCPESHFVKQRYLNIDGDAGTILTAFDGKLSNYNYLKCDSINTVHYLSENANVFVIGAGGGRDVLSALVFGQKSVTAVELNDEIIAAVNDRFGDFTGHLDQLPGVSFKNDEARSYLTRSGQRYDIIQISLIDTLAATAAGAFALSENALYTKEAWGIFYDHLTPRGILSVSRWYKEGAPLETYRTVALGVSGLAAKGVASPKDHLILIHSAPKNYEYRDKQHTVATLLTSVRPFDAATVQRVHELAAQYEFSVLIAPDVTPLDPTLLLLQNGELEKATELAHGNITPPTDEQPFFFNFVRFRDIFSTANWPYHNFGAITLLASLAVIVLFLTAIAVSIPFAFARKHMTARTTALTIYFLGIGMGFIAIEIGLLQRLAIYFGHPSYALSVVLPTILVSSGIGSFLTGERMQKYCSPMARLFALVAVACVTVLLLPMLVKSGVAWDTPVRILVAVLAILPLGILMGMPFSMGMRATHDGGDANFAPWLWGLNGIASVASSIFAVIVSLAYGITFAFFIGILGYVVTLFAARRLRI